MNKRYWRSSWVWNFKKFTIWFEISMITCNRGEKWWWDSWKFIERAIFRVAVIHTDMVIVLVDSEFHSISGSTNDLAGNDFHLSFSFCPNQVALKRSYMMKCTADINFSFMKFIERQSLLSWTLRLSHVSPLNPTRSAWIRNCEREKHSPQLF